MRLFKTVMLLITIVCVMIAVTLIGSIYPKITALTLAIAGMGAMGYMIITEPKSNQ